MRAMLPQEQRNHERAVSRVLTAVQMLEYLPDDLKENEDIAVARARLADWLSANEGRWVV
jgi:hypothetical protein